MTDTERKTEVAGYEARGRAKAIKALLTINKDLQIKETPIDTRYDLWFTSGDTIIAETKDREMESTDFSTKMLDANKYDYLMSIPCEHIFYINTFTDNRCMIWDIKQTKPVQRKQVLVNVCDVDPSLGKELRWEVFFSNNDAKYIVRYDL